MHHRAFGIAALLCLAGGALGQTGFTISGSMSNFDCSNHCDTECDEMEIQIDDASPSDIIHTYTNGNYGAPTVTLSSDGLSTIVDYRTPHHPTAVNSIEHFGVTIRGAVYYGPPATYHRTHVRWYRNGRPATVNGRVPVEGGGTAPATQPMLPSITAAITPGSNAHGGISLTVTNNDPFQAIWVKRRAIITTNPVTLESLMTNNPVVTSTVELDSAPIKLEPSQSFTVSNDLIEVEEEQSAVFTAQYFQNVQNADPFGPADTYGPELGNIMTAAVTSPQDLQCAHSIPTITSQPADQSPALGSRVDLRVVGRGDDVSPLTYVWMKDGAPMVDGNGVSGTTSNHVRINSFAAANEGFYSVRITNTCASILSKSALVFLPGHNQPPQRPAFCMADFNADGIVDPDDLADYIGVFFTLPVSAGADVNGDGVVDPDDLSDYIGAFFAGC